MSEPQHDFERVPVPDEAFTAMFDLVQDAYSRGRDHLRLSYPMDEEGVSALTRDIARPVVVAELLSLAGKVLNLPVPDNVDPDGFDAARWAFREMIADRCDELGTRVEEL